MCIRDSNAGTRKLEQDATIPGLGDVKYDPNLSANVLGFNFLRSVFPTTYDLKNNCINVVTSNRPIQFTEKKGLYVYKPTPKYLKIIEDLKAKEGTSDESFGLMETADRVDCAEAVPTTGIPDRATDDENLAGVDPPDEGDGPPPLEESSESDSPGDDFESDESGDDVESDDSDVYMLSLIHI